MTLATDFMVLASTNPSVLGAAARCAAHDIKQDRAQMTQATFVYYCSIMPEHAQVRSSYGGA